MNYAFAWWQSRTPASYHGKAPKYASLASPTRPIFTTSLLNMCHLFRFRTEELTSNYVNSEILSVSPTISLAQTLLQTTVIPLTLLAS